MPRCSQAMREVAKHPKPEEMSFRTYGKLGGVELVFLLQASLTGIVSKQASE